MKETVESLVSKAFAVEAGVDARQLASLRALAAHEAKRRGSRRMAWRVGVPTMLAASLAVLLSFGVAGRRERGVVRVTDAIGLLCEMDGIAREDLGEVSTEELILAWQEAPFRDWL